MLDFCAKVAPTDEANIRSIAFYNSLLHQNFQKTFPSSLSDLKNASKNKPKAKTSLQKKKNQCHRPPPAPALGVACRAPAARAQCHRRLQRRAARVAAAKAAERRATLESGLVGGVCRVAPGFVWGVWMDFLVDFFFWEERRTANFGKIGVVN